MYHDCKRSEPIKGIRPLTQVTGVYYGVKEKGSVGFLLLTHSWEEAKSKYDASGEGKQLVSIKTVLTLEDSK
jgi:hypothetical protein